MTVEELRTLLADLPGYYGVVVEDADDSDAVHPVIVGVELRYDDAAIRVVLPYTDPEVFAPVALPPVVESSGR
ncbi:hypothetical protein [Pimelobacter simplex]|uniref:hypothetical protein n=1 Tax=Nocardioides simplex TaxID=2045 RepID=UPI00214FD7A7|nr:hypothetical protein [Pimelobacter simplex]UUW92682.1 hypothetical protein M0M43_14720 [Pimelobacter simplex]UUW96510.1 hypothetical protein M0M48_03355 [Pimelobacter simplex]